MAGIVAILAPDCIVVCGGVARAWELFEPAMHRTLQAHAFGCALAGLRVVRGALGDRAALVGAVRAQLLDRAGMPGGIDDSRGSI
jgi:predicted NBD/HSP70 family sugar kinase